jgi:hypothetical protein
LKELLLDFSGGFVGATKSTMQLYVEPLHRINLSHYRVNVLLCSSLFFDAGGTYIEMTNRKICHHVVRAATGNAP